MNWYSRILLLVLIILLVSCFIGDTNSTKSGTVAANLNGEWSVEQWELSTGARQFGALTIKGNSYIFQPIAGAEIPAWMEARFSFINQPVGTITFDYSLGVSPTDSISNLEDNAMIVICRFNEQKEAFFVQVDHTQQEIRFHSTYSELQRFDIRKNYEQ
jgi:hypothetical protein